MMGPVLLWKFLPIACRGTLSQQAPGNGLQIKPQVNDPSTAQNPIRELHQRKQKQRTHKRSLPHLRELWLKTQKQNVCLFASFVLDMTANMFQCKMKCKTSQTECSHHHKSKQNNHVASNAFMAAFRIPLAKVVLYLAVSDLFTSFMAACWSTHLHCPKFWFMIITNGRELEVNPKLLPTAFPEAVRKPVAHKWTCTSK